MKNRMSLVWYVNLIILNGIRQVSRSRSMTGDDRFYIYEEAIVLTSCISMRRFHF